MTVKTVDVACDWPGCPAVLRTRWYPGAFYDNCWAPSDHRERLGCRHFCPAHRGKSAAEYQEAANAAAHALEISQWEADW